MIFKVQRPLGGDMGPALVYNRDRSRKAFVPYTEVAALFLDNGFPAKLYVEAELAGGVFRVAKIVPPPQDW